MRPARGNYNISIDPHRLEHYAVGDRMFVFFRPVRRAPVAVSELTRWPNWDKLSAVQSGKVHYLESFWFGRRVNQPNGTGQEAHFATFPPKLIEPCILAGSPQGGIVLDPFMGSGTTAMVAKNNGRHYIATELNSGYIEIAKSRI